MLLAILAATLVLAATGIVVYFTRITRVEAPSEDATQAPSVEIPTDQAPDAETGERAFGEPKSDSEMTMDICDRQGVVNRRPVEAGKAYATRPASADQSAQSQYNDYLFCTMFLSERNGSPAEGFIEGSDSFSQAVFARESFVSLDALNDIFGSDSCESEGVDAAVTRIKRTAFEPEEGAFPKDLQNEFVGGFEENLRNISSADLCGLFKRVPSVLERLKGADFCSGNPDCLALMNDDEALCDGIATGVDSDKTACRDTVRYHRALQSGDISECSEVELSYKNIACQAYFLGEHADMCDGLVNGFHEASCL